MFKCFRKEEPKVNYGKIVAIVVGVVIALAGVAFAVVKYLEKKKYDEYLEELCDCDCDCGCQDGDECTCGCCDDDFDDEEYYEIECPSCGEIICFDEDIDPEELTCPACHEKISCLVDEDDIKAVDGEDK